MFVFVTVVCAFVCVCECVFDNMCVLLNSHCVDFRLKLMFVLRNGKVTVFSSKIFACGGLLAGSPSGWPASADFWQNAGAHPGSYSNVKKVLNPLTYTLLQ